jgi:hypothetical protein
MRHVLHLRTQFVLSAKTTGASYDEMPFNDAPNTDNP